MCLGKIGCIRTKKYVVFDMIGCIRAKLVLFGQIGCIPEIGCIWAKLVVFVQNWLYSIKLVAFGQNLCIRANWVFFWAKLVVLVQN